MLAIVAVVVAVYLASGLLGGRDRKIGSGQVLPSYVTMASHAAGSSGQRRYSPWVPPEQRRRRKSAAELLLHIGTKGSPQPWEKPRFKQRSTRSVSNFLTENKTASHSFFFVRNVWDCLLLANVMLGLPSLLRSLTSV